MATVNKDFKIKSGLIVEGTTGTINGYDILTKKTDDQNYIISLIGGSATSNATPDTVVLRDGDANFAANEITANLFVGDLDGQAATVDSLSGHTTTEISEGSNLYFTNQRALDATNAAYDAAGSAADAQDAAESYADGLISTEVTNRNSAISTAKGEAIADANDYTDGEITDALTTAQGYATTAQGNAEDYADGLISTEVTNRNSAITTAIDSEVTARNGAISTAKSEAIADANDYTDSEIAALVDSAPAMLDTLGELATALQENPDIISDLQDIAAGKQDSFTAGSGLVFNGTSLDVELDPTSGLSLATGMLAVDTNIIATTVYADGVASDALDSAEDYTDSAISTEVTNRNSAISDAISTEVTNRNSAISDAISTEISNRNGAISDAISTEVSDRNSAITSAVNALTTSDIEEGTNLYFTDGRAKTSAADLLTGATLTNITITGSGSGLTITAENGVADSTTSDLTEGSNLYFTAQRAVDALEAVVPNFTAVELNSVAKQVAATTSVPVAGIATGYAWAKADYRSAEFLVKVAYGSHTEISKVLVTLDSSDNIAITEYGIVGTNGSASSVSAGISGNDVQLQVTTVNNNSTVTVVGTLLA
jgi:hypothetical protein